MADIAAIIKFLDNYLQKNNKESLTPPEANELLEKAGLLKDSNTRKGLPLRKLLRKDELPHAFKVGRFWSIPHSKKKR